MKTKYIFLLLIAGASLHAQQQSMSPGQQRRQRLGWNSQGRSQYGTQMRQNQIGLQQLQQNRWQQSSGNQNQTIRTQRQRGNWDAASRSSYQQQMKENHEALQQMQQLRRQQQQTP